MIRSAGDTFRAAIARLDKFEHPVGQAIRPVLKQALNRYEGVIVATQHPSRGVDQEPGIHYGDPEAARRTAEGHVVLELGVAEAVLDWDGAWEVRDDS